MIKVTRIDPLHPDALRMIDGSEAEQSALYPPEHRFAFSPEQLVAEDVRFFIARQGEVALGCCGYALNDGYAELKRLYVAPAARGTGAAGALVDAAEAAAKAESVPLMRLETGNVSHAALKFYTRHGYTDCPPFGGYTENGSSVFMEKAL